MEPAENQNFTAEPVVKVEAIDVSLLEDSLQLTPWQRLVENERIAGVGSDVGGRQRVC